MKLGTNLSIGTRLALGFALVILIAIAVAVTGRALLGQAAQQARVLTDDRGIKVRQARDIKEEHFAIASLVRDLLIAADPAYRRQQSEAIVQARARAAEHLQALERTIRSERSRALLQSVHETRARYLPAGDKVIALALAQRSEEARSALSAELEPAQAAYFEAVDALIAHQRELMEGLEVEIAASLATAGALMIGGAVLAALLGGLIAWRVTIGITRPLRRAAAIVQQVSEGDLGLEVKAEGRDESAQLLRSLAAMIASLRNLVGQVRSGVDSVGTASAQIAAGNADLSSRTEQQASSLQQTAASMEQMTATVKHNADAARQANQLAASASQVAAKGGAVVTQVIQRMEEISESSSKIAEIINVIDGIAFQTNILALNAAVEAARAGEQGRGFAVVAGEVRNLAQRSAQAAREIKALITDSVIKVESGSALVDDAGRTMGEIVAQVKRVTDLIGEISSSTLEQSSGIGQVNQAVNQLDQMTQQNAALVEESAAAAASLREQADRLAQAVAAFRLSRQETRQAIDAAQARAGATLAQRAAAAPPAARPRQSPPAAWGAATARKPPADAGGDWKEF
jgi:methyl-accepting chemotaxis protein